jgi:aldehyde dehydrogenase (NAD+)
MWGKFCNAGQICIGSDHLVLVGTPEQEEKFLSLAKKVATTFSRGGNIARIVNEAHFERLSGLLKNTKGQVIHGGELDKSELKIGITIVQGVTKDDSLMSDEIFGPLLPVLRVGTVDEAISLIRQSETPLAMYPHILIYLLTMNKVYLLPKSELYQQHHG